MVPTALPCFHLSPTDTVAGKHAQPAHGGSFIGGCPPSSSATASCFGVFFFFFFFSFWQCWGWNQRALHALGKHSTTEAHPLLPALDVFCQPSPAPKSNHSLSLKATFLAHTSAGLTSRLPLHTLPSTVTSTKQPASSSWAFV